MIPRYGTPRTFLTDQGSNFTSRLMTQVCKILNIEKIQTSPYHPSSNGMIERMNKIITDGLSHFVNKNQDDWDQRLPGLLYAFRSTPISSKGKSPFELLYGKPMTIPADIDYMPIEHTHTPEDTYLVKLKERLQDIHTEAKHTMTKSREVMTRNNDPHFEPFKEKDQVWLKTIPKQGRNKKLSAKFTGPHEITQYIHPSLYVLKTPTG